MGRSVPSVGCTLVPDSSRDAGIASRNTERSPFGHRSPPISGEMPPLADRHIRAMRVAVDQGRTTAIRASRALGVTRSAAGGALRALERAGYLHGELVGGGEVGYSVTAAGRAWLQDRSSTQSRANR
jgi:hypothetical protein